MSIEAGKAKAAKLRAEHERYHEGKRATKVATLIAEGAVGRPELKRMRDVWYSTDKPTKAGTYWNPKGKASARGSDAKARKINTGHRARQMQGL
ncbi:hypothetical protein D3C85_1584440 [compost metagenome]